MKLIIHGGFFSESTQSLETKKAKQNALLEIATKSFQYLQHHSAVETVVYAVSLLEDCDLFNAGLGSQIQSDGLIRMSASLMDGDSKKFSGVINIQNIQNPIKVASLLMHEDDRVLGGEGANAYASKNNVPFFNPELPQRRAEYEAKLKSSGLGTVGCVALDANGKIAAATSTGGKGFELVGRISDSATTAGNFANQFAGVSCTGVGEDIVSASLASSIVTRVSDGMSLNVAFEKSFASLKEFDGFAGAIAIDAAGNYYHADSFPYMVWATADASGSNCFQ
jgi:L-asparaginase